MNLDTELNFLLNALEDTRILALSHFQKGRTIDWKEDRSPVTVADREIETQIRRAIWKTFPDHNIIGEEMEEDFKYSKWRWVIDPIDGTRSFICGVPLFSTLLSLEFEEQPVLAGISIPALGEMFWAIQGGGAFRNGSHIRVANDVDPTRATLCHGSVTSLHKKGRFDGILKLGKQVNSLRNWGDGYGYCLVASGQTHAMIDPVVQHHDVSAPSLLIKEAGGVWSDFAGVDCLAHEAIATVPSMQKMILEAFV